ncbi:4-amino-4-deoxy-L-arabinose transferase-like glycosyltransferase [Amycolatopsis bartoniae]|uniref:Glycosyltransferase RgtA/B/C/D-like domain-containing protein n=1 Tax=Amycolatopsis bartoniae TaxID=941986 RepID=A0A8H9J028_9PSEU|nr:glycosyltransferase family 39 protein [Amycolatopsis bartoniae]MBB2933722.1 4-amino-4-deoxy-L-arabinose transferase-like glycosyltransferase [Amycolatopsis bartoniae]TVT10608.1 glycosyltransferase family 39 protein [Amycolatopsis bartoniae]GHF72079.1 hypothetical protein GCM10017566_52390 [Amycolatopsis bartoniae]
MTALAVRAPVRWLDAHARHVALGAVVLSLVLAGGYAVLLGDTLRYLDERVYVQLAGSLAHGLGYSADGVQATAYRPPGYPFLLTPVYWATGGSVLAMRFVGVLALAGSVWFGYRVGRRAASAPAGALAAVVLACYPLLAYTATALYPQVPGLFLLLVTIDRGFAAADDHRVGNVLAAGLCGGLLVITVPNFALSVVLVPLWMVWRRRAARGVAAAILALVLAVPGAWCLRNAVSLHAFVPVSTNDGINLLLGNSEHTTAGSGTEVDISRYEQAARDAHLDEVGINGFFSDSAVDWITAHPADAVVLYGKKLANTFSFSSDMATSGQGGGAADLVLALTYYPVLLLAVLRVALARRWPLTRVETLLAVLVVLNFLLQAVFFTRLRFRVPLDALTIVLAASVVARFVRGSRGAQSG